MVGQGIDGQWLRLMRNDDRRLGRERPRAKSGLARTQEVPFEGPLLIGG
jgi:hypothetical protein